MSSPSPNFALILRPFGPRCVMSLPVDAEAAEPDVLGYARSNKSIENVGSTARDICGEQLVVAAGV